jgi:hypothetical protein
LLEGGGAGEVGVVDPLFVSVGNWTLSFLAPAADAASPGFNNVGGELAFSVPSAALSPMATSRVGSGVL